MGRCTGSPEPITISCSVFLPMHPCWEEETSLHPCLSERAVSSSRRPCLICSILCAAIFFFFCSRSRACSVLCAASCVRQEGSMADPVATVERIVKIGLKIKEAVDWVRHNEEDCREITRRVLRFSTILSQLQQTGTVADSPAMAGALEDLEETLQRALELVTACQERATTTIRRVFAAGDLSKQLRRVQEDILNKVMLASFAINAHTTILLLTIQAGGHPPPRQHQADAGLTDISNNIHSTEDARSDLNSEENIVLTGNDPPFAPLVALKNFCLSELKDAINGGNIIGEGGSCKVYKGVLMDGNVVAIKIFKRPHKLSGWWCTYDQKLLLASKLQHQNIVKVLGYGHELGSSSVIMRLLKHKIHPAKERVFFWVEEYVPNGTLYTKIHESLLDWPSVSRILKQVAQGIHYLHEQCVVHKDLKPSNILLDSDMNPKIIDFEFSMVLNDETESLIAGTVAYMAPEYTMRGIVSMKNDIFAFGAILLETVSRSMCRSKPRGDCGLLHVYKWAWEAWEAGLTEELFDPSLIDGSPGMEIRRWVQVGLLCIQHHREDRPSIADVLEMLNGKEELPTPKKPAYMKSDERREIR